MTRRASNGPVGASNGPVGASNEPVGACNGPVGASNEPVEASNEPVEACNGPVGACNEPVGACNEPVGACNEPVGACNGPVGACDEPIGLGSASVGCPFIEDAARTPNDKSSAIRRCGHFGVMVQGVEAESGSIRTYALIPRRVPYDEEQAFRLSPASKNRRILNLHKQAAKLGFQLTPAT